MPKSSIHRTAGFSLVEIMVGLAIGMLAVIVILQVFALSEQRKRTTTSGGDAQSNGAITFYRLQSDIGQAGYGLSATSLFGCNAKWALAAGNITTAVSLAPVTINPAVAIIPAGDTNTDTLLVIYGNTNGEPQGNTINAQAGTVNTVQMAKNMFAVDDKVIVAPDSCGATELFVDKVTAVDADAHKVTATQSNAGTKLYNLGPAPAILAYAVRGSNLTVCDYMVNDCGVDANKSNASIWVPIAPNIVSMRVQYARDTSAPMDAIPNVYDQITPGSADDTSGIAAQCGWARVSAVRLALVTRSSQYDKNIVTANALTWAGTAADNPAGSTSDPINLTKNPDGTANTSWQHYRYKLFETTVPIRNVAWLGVPTGC